MPIEPRLHARAPSGGVRYVLQTVEDAARVMSIATKEPLTLRMMALIQDGDLVVEVGASMGIYSVCFAKACAPSGKVICVEPDREKVLRLKRNLILNDVTRISNVVEKCASDVSGPDSLTLESVIDSNQGRYGNIFLKVDTDGNEIAVLRGLGECFSDAHRRPRLIQVEQSIHDTEISQFLEARDYRLVLHDTPHRHDAQLIHGRRLSGISWWVSTIPLNR